ncbi:uncharacterized protein LOC116165359 isoform X2 [Photinus pyralis]|uniref:uncharacterized protein LOC116165359 isoform X2 n=1 Tax=Photinus pyralis TaxID=7054 RepID=UPI0012670C3B|nr:uncharacterized protein LOC116165359 isoform X2 [Photinus pyralis]
MEDLEVDENSKSIESILEMWVKCATMDADESHVANPSVRVVEMERQSSQSCGFHLTRSKWDPYPWVSKVDGGTAADTAGMQPGECVLEVNGEDVVGKRISEIAERVRSGSSQISLLLWNSGVDARCSSQSICCGSLPQNLQRFSTCVSSVLSFMECPVCLDTISPPAHQCENGHLVCFKCRTKTERCPVCRIRLTRVRSLLAEQIYNVITDVFCLSGETQKDQKFKMQSIFKLSGKRKDVPDIKVTQTHTNKFLARLIGKSTSVDNLSNDNNRSASSVTEYPFEEHFVNNLKAKSLSTSEICKFYTSCTSRASSFNNLSTSKRLGKRFLNAEKVSGSSPTSLQGSVESMLAKVAGDDVLYPCPYTDNCTALIKEAENISDTRRVFSAVNIHECWGVYLQWVLWGRIVWHQTFSGESFFSFVSEFSRILRDSDVGGGY